MLVLARANRMSDWLDGDVAMRGSGGTEKGYVGGGAAAARHAAGRQSQRQHHAGIDGMPTTNRRGRKLCSKWQEGQCAVDVVAAHGLRHLVQCHAVGMCRKAVATPKTR